jgi:hypothetical protein
VCCSMSTLQAGLRASGGVRSGHKLGANEVSNGKRGKRISWKHSSLFSVVNMAAKRNWRLPKQRVRRSCGGFVDGMRLVRLCGGTTLTSELVTGEPSLPQV